MALALCLVWLCLNCSTSNAQTVDPTTGLLMYSTGNLTNFNSSPTSTTGTWQNVGQFGGSLTCWAPGGPGYCGPQPYVNANGYGMINFSWGMTNLNQTVNVNSAVSGTGVYVTGFNFVFTAKNGNGWDNGQQDYLTAYVKLNNTAGQTVENYNYNLNSKFNWTQFNYSETFSTPHAASGLSTAQYGFIGKDSNNWAGPYGPEIMNVNFSLKYGVDPCSQNIAYSSSCPGFNSLVTSGNLLNPNYYSQYMNQAVNINQALQNAGIGATVYGVNYAFDWYVGGQQCSSSFLFWCTGWSDSNLNVNVGLTGPTGNSLYSKGYSFSGQYIGGTVTNNFVLPTPQNQTALGAGYINSSGWGDSGIGNLRASLVYTPDPCVADPLYSPLCKGYSLAYAKNMILGSTVALATSPTGLALAQTGANQTATIQQALAPAPPPPQPANPAPQPAPPPQGPAPQPGPAQDPNQNPSVVAANPSQPNPTQPAPQQAGAPQPAGGPQQTPAQQTASNPPQAGPQPAGKTAVGPSATAMSAVKSAQEKDKATQQMAVQNAARVVEASTQQSQATATAAVNMLNDMSANSASAAAQFSSQTTQASFQTVQTVQTQQQTTQSASQQTQQQTFKMVQQAPQEQQTQQTQSQSYTGLIQQTQSAMAVQQQQDTQSTTVAMLKPSAPAPVEVSPQASIGTGITLSRNPFTYSPLTPTTNMFATQSTPAFQFRNEVKTTEVETPQIQIASFGGIGRAGSPLSDMMSQQRFELLQTSIEQRTDTVNRNAEQNELAGGVKLEAMALQPKGFEAYSVVLRDAAFYEPKEVYRNQTTVDNVRALRQLASDRLHQQMIELQYKIGE